MQENTNKSGFVQDYYLIKQSIRNDLEDIAKTAVRVVDFESDELLAKCTLSFRKNSEYIENSASKFYFCIRDAFRNAARTGNEYESNSEYNSNSSEFNETTVLNQPMQLNEARQVFSNEHLTGSKKKYAFHNFHSCKDNYTSSIERIINSSDSVIKETATVLSGKLYNSYSVKKRKPRRLWRWDERIEYVRSLLAEKNIGETGKREIAEIKSALQKNKYLRYRKSDAYKLLNSCLDYAA